MDDPVDHYYETIERIVNTVQNVEVSKKIGPTWIPNKKEWLVVTLRIEFEFHSGQVLVITDNHKRMDIRSQPARRFSYYFGDDSGRIFLIDTHGKHGEPCHAHLYAGKLRFEEGDNRLGGFSLSTISFPKVFGLVAKYLEGKPFPWDKA